MSDTVRHGSDTYPRRVRNCSHEKNKNKIGHVLDTARTRIGHLGPFNSRPKTNQPIPTITIHWLTYLTRAKPTHNFELRRCLQRPPAPAASPSPDPVAPDGHRRIPTPPSFFQCCRRQLLSLVCFFPFYFPFSLPSVLPPPAPFPTPPSRRRASLARPVPLASSLPDVACLQLTRHSRAHAPLPGSAHPAPLAPSALLSRTAYGRLDLWPPTTLVPLHRPGSPLASCSACCLYCCYAIRLFLLLVDWFHPCGYAWKIGKCNHVMLCSLLQI